MQVNLVGDQATAVKMLDEVVVPATKALAGFQGGTWMHNEANVGTGVIMFDTTERRDGGDGRPEAPAGRTTIIDVAVFEVARQV